MVGVERRRSERGAAAEGKQAATTSSALLVAGGCAGKAVRRVARVPHLRQSEPWQSEPEPGGLRAASLKQGSMERFRCKPRLWPSRLSIS